MQPSHYHSCYHLLPQVNQCQNVSLLNSYTLPIIITFFFGFGVSLFLDGSLFLVALSFSFVDVGLSVLVSLVGTLFLTEGWHLCFVGENCKGPSKSLIWALMCTNPLSLLRSNHSSNCSSVLISIPSNGRHRVIYYFEPHR